MKALREPLWWLIALFIGLLAGLPYSAPLFSRLFPELPRPVYQQDSFWALTRSRLAGGGVQPRGNGNRAGGWGGGHPARRQRVSSAGGDHRRYRADLSAGGGAGDGGAGAGLWLAAGADSPRVVWHTAGAAGDTGRAGFDTAWGVRCG